MSIRKEKGSMEEKKEGAWEKEDKSKKKKKM
jgi:hypothetical protein